MPTPRNRSRKDNPILQPGYKRATPPGNAGRRWPSEILTPAEVRQLFDAYAGAGYGTIRDLAMITLMYRAEFKMSELLALERRHFNPGEPFILRPAGKRTAEQEVALDRDSREALDHWMKARRKLGVPVTAPLFCTISRPNIGGKLGAAAVREMLKTRAHNAGLDRRVHPQGIRDSGIKHRQDSREKVHRQIGPYVSTESFQSRYPDCYDRWEAALDLQRAHPETNSRRIGLDCREAIQLFVDEAAALHGLQLPNEGDVAADLRALLRAFTQDSEDLSRHSQALIAYWSAMYRLAHRQVHSDDRGAGELRPVDADRLIFHTLVVMLEIDRTLPAPPAMTRANRRRARTATG